MISANRTQNDWFDKVMREKVAEHWDMIESCGYEDASLEDQFGLATSWSLMLDD